MSIYSLYTAFTILVVLSFVGVIYTFFLHITTKGKATVTKNMMDYCIYVFIISAIFMVITGIKAEEADCYLQLNINNEVIIEEIIGDQ